MVMGQEPESGDPSRVAWADELVTGLFRDHYQPFYRSLRAKNFSHDDTCDILNACGAAIYRRLVNKGPLEGNPVAYFRKAVKNQSAQYQRDRRRELADVVGDEILMRLLDDRFSALTGTASALSPQRSALLEAAHKALGELPPYLREPYELKVYGSLEPEEIANLLNLRPGTVRSYLSVAGAAVKDKVDATLRAGADKEGEDDG
jgi:DNA-directed RNA polymerase specialized sigma24 family protein